MSPKPIPTVPLGSSENTLLTKYYESVTAQSDLMDKLGERLLTLEIAIPGLLATALKLIHGEKATTPISTALYLAFGCWLAALVLTLIALTPKDWLVDPTVVKQDPHKFSEGLGLEDFFRQAALYKRRLLIPSSLLLFAGIVSAVFTLR